MKNPKISVIASMLDFSENGELDIRLESLDQVIVRAVDSIECGAAAGGIKICQQLTPDLPKLKIDKAKIGGVIVSLLTNAVQTSGSGQDIRVRSFGSQINQLISDAELEKMAHFRKGDKVIVIEVRDHGSGIPEDRIFDPFYTSGCGERGRGPVSLFAAKSIVNLHGGYLQVQNVSPSGVRSRIMLRV